MANGALTLDEEDIPAVPTMAADDSRFSNEDKAALAAADATQDADMVGALSGPSRIVTPESPKANTTNLDERVSSYKKRTKDIDIDGRKDSTFKRSKSWVADKWNKGKDDPNTEIREDQTVEVTKFMGGMTRQELSMFIFEWGGLMMQNAEEGFGGAMGAAGTGAMQGHQARTGAAAEKEESKAQQIIENQLEKQKADAATITAESVATRANEPKIQWGSDGAYTIETDENGKKFAVPVEGNDGQLQPGLTPGTKQGQYRDKWMMEQMMEAGYTKRQALDFINGAPTQAEVKQTITKIWLNYDARTPLRVPGSTIVKKKSEFTGDEQQKWINDQVSGFGNDGALPSSTDPGKDAVDEYSE